MKRKEDRYYETDNEGEDEQDNTNQYLNANAHNFYKSQNNPQYGMLSLDLYFKDLGLFI